jgi:hypothetical protein
MPPESPGSTGLDAPKLPDDDWASGEPPDEPDPDWPDDWPDDDQAGAAWTTPAPGGRRTVVTGIQDPAQLPPGASLP